MPALTLSPLPIYLGAIVHTNTSKRDLAYTQYDLGLSVSYDKVLNSSLIRPTTSAIVIRWRKCQLKGGLFTAAAIDDIDDNTNSTSSHDS